MFASATTALWSIVLPLILGAAAVYLLLPKGRRTSLLMGAALGGLALLLAGALVVPTGSVNAETSLFYAFSAIAIVGGTSLITHANPVHAALSFALVVLSTCGLFLLLAAPFLMAATIIVYAGAIIVTFLFVIMLAQQFGLSNADQRSREPFLATLAGFVSLGALLYVLNMTYDTGELARLMTRAQAIKEQLGGADNASITQQAREEIDKILDGFQHEGKRFAAQTDGELLWRVAENAKLETEWKEIRTSLDLLQGHATKLRDNPASLQTRATGLSTFSGPPANQEPRRDSLGRPQLPAENVAYLGRSLFTDYLLAVELGGTLLLVATIGAIAITARRGERVP